MDTHGIQDTIESLSKLFHNKMAQFELDLQGNAQPSSNIAGLTSEFTAFREFITTALKTLQQQMEILAYRMDRLEMEGRRKILLLHGVTEDKNENPIQAVVNLVRTQLKLDSFSASDIKHCHRMGRPTSPHRHRPILIKMQHIPMRDKIWFAKTKLKGSGITVSEFLTKTRHNLFMAAREKLGVSKCWTKEGCVYVLGVNGERQRIVSLEQLGKLSRSDTNVSSEPSVSKKSEPPKARRAAANKK